MATKRDDVMITRDTGSTTDRNTVAIAMKTIGLYNENSSSL